jgi:pimeloyl-ACP methyl ester carboxylesterase
MAQQLPVTGARERRAYADCRFGQLHLRYRRPGAETLPPVLCFHMSPSSSRSYQALLRELGSDRLAMAADTPGYGQSDRPAEPCGIPGYAAAMGDALDALDMPKLDLVGFHTGSKIALSLALQRPERVRRLVLIGAPVYSEEELAAQRKAYVPVEPEEDGSHLARRWKPYLLFRGPGQTVEMLQREFTDSLLPGPDYEWGHAAAFAWQHGEYLPKLAHPVLVLCPDDDLTKQTLRAEPLVRNGAFRRLPGWGHGLLEVQAPELADILRGFLDGPAADL